MKTTLKKLMAVLLAVTMAMSLFAINASALFDWEDDMFFGSETVRDNIWYSLDGETMTATVTGYDIDDEGASLAPAEVVIPATVENEGETYTVTEIGFFAFAECSTVEKITLPETIVCINDYAFSAAGHLETVIIPETNEFEYFGTYVFDGTPAMNYFAENSADGAVILGKNVLLAYLGNEKSYTVPEEITIIADYCFFMSGVEEVILNENIEEIREFTFASCRNLKEITVPDSVLYIGEGAFSNCTSLEKVNLGDCLEAIGIKAFEGTKIKEIYIGEMMYDAAGAFAGCNTLEKITCHEDSMYYMDGETLCVHVEFVDEDGTVWIDEDYIEYFMITSDATSYTVPEDISWIGNYAFYNCKQLESVTLTAPTVIGSYAFAHCEFDSFDFDKVSGVSMCAFRSCKNITSANLSNAGFIDDSAFENCTSLAEVTFGDELVYIGSRAFANTAIKTVDIGGDLNEVSEGAFANCPELTRANFNDGVWYICTAVFTNCPKLERVYIAESVEYIEEGAFDGCKNATFEIIKYSYGYDYAEDNDLNYEIVGKVSFFTRVAKFFTNLFYTLFGWLMF